MGHRPLLSSASILLLTLTLLGGCAALPLLRHVPKGDQTTISPADEDGTRYISVEGGPLSSARSLHTRWKNTARQACEGDYQLISESGSARRHNGIIRSRTHEGFIQCLLPDGSEPGAPQAPTMAEATTPSPRLGRR